MTRKDTIAGIPKGKYWEMIRIKSAKKKPLRRIPIKKKAYKIKKRAKKISAEERVYSVLRKDFLKDHPVCECGRKNKDGKVCQREATDIHHQRGRINSLLNDTRYWLAVARLCHNWIELHPSQAKELGLSLNRLN